MDIMEIVLLAAGGVIFILSFFIPTKKGESSGETKGLVKEEIKAMVSDELAAVRGHVDEVVGGSYLFHREDGTFLGAAFQ